MDIFSIILLVAVLIFIVIMLRIISRELDALSTYNKIQDMQIDLFREMNKSQDRINNYFGERLTALELQMESLKNEDEKNEPEDK